MHFWGCLSEMDKKRVVVWNVYWKGTCRSTKYMWTLIRVIFNILLPHGLFHTYLNIGVLMYSYFNSCNFQYMSVRVFTYAYCLRNKNMKYKNSSIFKYSGIRALMN